jgi:hypothetical protein
MLSYRLILRAREQDGDRHLTPEQLHDAFDLLIDKDSSKCSRCYLNFVSFARDSGTSGKIARYIATRNTDVCQGFGDSGQNALERLRSGIERFCFGRY